MKIQFVDLVIWALPIAAVIIILTIKVVSQSQKIARMKNTSDRRKSRAA